nr:TnsD family Tn7-like transposition protein [Cupriavidus taiwanensis]
MLADDCSAYEAAMLQPSTGANAKNSRLYAWAAMQLLKTEPTGDIRTKLLEQMVMLGYANEGCRWKAARFSVAWAALSKEGFEDVRLSLMAASEEFPLVLMRGLTRTERPMHPAFLALLCWFLFREAEARAVVPAGDAARTSSIPKAAPELLKHAPPQCHIEERRRKWLHHGAAHPSATRTELRRSLYCVWQWLYRHDAEWLLQNEPAAIRKPAPKNCRFTVGPVLAARIEASKIDDKDARGMPHTHTKYQNRVRYGMSDYAYDRLLRENPALANGCFTRQELVGLRTDHLRYSKGVDVSSYSLATRARALSLRPETLGGAEIQTTKNRKDN